MENKSENKHIAICIAMFIIGGFLMALVQPYTRQEELVWQWYVGFVGLTLIFGSGLIAFFKILFLNNTWSRDLN